MSSTHLARRAASLPPIASNRGEGIPFDSGHGFADVFPDMALAAEVALTRFRSETLQYGERLGLRALRNWIAGYLNDEGAHVSADEILVTNGAKHAIDLVCRLLLDEGDSIVITAPTYFSAIPIFKSFGAECIEIDQDAEGLKTDDLAEALRQRVRDDLELPKFIYAMPDFHNPTGITMSRERREALLEIAEEHGLYVIEDSPYRTVRFTGAPQPTLKSLDKAQLVINIGTFSKLIAPGLRVGWVAAAQDPVSRMSQLKTDGGSSPLTQRIIAEWLGSGHLEEHACKVRSLYLDHRDRMVAAISREMPDVNVAVPEGGYYLWVTLPDGVDCDEFTARAGNVGVKVISGRKFYAEQPGGRARGGFRCDQHVRLAYSHCSPPEIEEGMRRLAHVFASMTPLRRRREWTSQ